MKTTEIQRGMVALAMVLACTTATFAQDVNEEMQHLYSLSSHYILRDYAEQMPVRQADMLAQRNVTAKRLPLSDLFGDVSAWSDGLNVYCLVASDDDNTLSVQMYGKPFETDFPVGKGLQRKGSVLTVKGRPGITVTYEEIGVFKVLVFRDKAGHVKDVLTQMDEEQANGYAAHLMDLHDIYDGLYAVGNGNFCVFGLKADHYVLNNYEQDPGMFVIINTSYTEIKDVLAYGEGRVSRGDPSSPNYDKMPGGGGAGAIMGPMIWKVEMTDSGVHVNLIRDEKFVDHSPRLPKDNIVLTKVATPYKDVPGRWAFASLRPLTRGLLMRFPAKALTLMRGEIYARHGDTFKNPDTQKYFDAQPWYKKSNKPVVLTAIEKMNVQLIKAVEEEKIAAESKVRANLKYVQYEYHSMAFHPYEEYVLEKYDNGEVHLKTNGSVGDRDYLVSDTVLTAVKRIIEECKMYEYASYYSIPIQPLDGDRWGFTARFEDQTISSGGRNAEPEDDEGLRRLSKLLFNVASAAEKKLRGEE